MATTTTKFCSVEEVHAELQQYAGYNGDDALISQQVEKATALIRSYTRRDWEKASYTEFFTTYDQDITIRQGRNYVVFPLKEKPIDLTTEPVVTFNTAGNFANTDPLQYDIDYFVDTNKNQIVMYPAKMEVAGRSLKVVYTAGYDINSQDTSLLDVPANIRLCCAIQAAFWTKRILNQTTGSTQKSDSTGFKVFATTRSGFVAEALNLIKSETRVLIGSNR
jgi:hypothetical protein